MPDPAEANLPPGPPRALHRALSLTGTVPLGAFLVLHLAANASTLRGDAAFDYVTRALARIPALPLVELLLVALPLAAHAGIGVWLVATRRPLAPAAPYPPALRAWVRATAIAALAFLALHLPEVRGKLGMARPTGGALATILDMDLSSTWHGVPWRGVAYLVGAAAVTLHFAAGAWGAFARTRRGEGPRARRVAGWVAAAIGAVMWLLFADVVVYHATGARLFGSPAVEPVSDEPCPGPSGSAR